MVETTPLRFDTRVLTLRPAQGDVSRVLLALTHQTKNIKNTAVYLIRQVISAYEYDRDTQRNVLRDELRPEQVSAIAEFNQQIVGINGKRTEKFPSKQARWIADGRLDGKEPKLKLVPFLGAQVEHLFATVLDATVLDNVVRHHRNENGDVVYRRVPGVVAQQVLKRVTESFASFAKAVKQYRADPAGMTGRPKLPGYLGKHERFVLEIPFVAIYGAMPSLGKRHIPEFTPEVDYLTEEMLSAFDSYDMKAEIVRSCKARKWPTAQPQHLRIVPLHKGVRMELVVRIPSPYPAESFLAKLVGANCDALAALKTEKLRCEWLLAHLKRMTILPRIAGIDLGVGNLASVAYSTGHRSVVHVGGRFVANVEAFTKDIAARVSRVTPARAVELQTKKTALAKATNVALEKDKERLSLAEEIELRTLLRAVYEDAEYRRLTAKKARWVSDYLHKTSTKLVQGCVANGIDVIVVGRNKGWKQQVNMGTEQNRKFCMIAHATLIQLLRYKAEAAGIALVTTEESYTSKTSFVNGDELECYADKTRDQATTTPAGAGRVPAVRTGKRLSADRNWFHHKNRDDRWKWVHADVNGAFNIVRKVFRDFGYHAGLTLKFDLLRLSNRLGIVPLNPLSSE